MKRAPEPAGLAAPLGPYSLVTTTPPGELVFIGGTIALDEAGEVVGVGDVAAQTEQVMENIGRALAAAGAGFDDVVKITTYVTEIDFYAELAPVRARYLTAPYPVSTLLEVSGLMLPDLLVEIDAIAVVGTGRGT
ncbi:MAG: RidA family protein [Actinobacteria bacterium]|nr:RidA family protein [Actinomycetota bacterium]